MTQEYWEQVKKRILQYNSPNGKCIKAFNIVKANCDAGKYSDTVQLPIKFLDEVLKLGLPYHSDAWSLDHTTDCSTLVRSVLYYWYGITLGGNTQTIFEKGIKLKNVFNRVTEDIPITSVKNLDEAPILCVLTWHLENKTGHPDATHTGYKYSQSKICHAPGGTPNVKLNDLHYYETRTNKADSTKTACFDFIGDARRALTTVGYKGNPLPPPTPPSNGGDNGGSNSGGTGNTGSGGSGGSSTGGNTGGGTTVITPPGTPVIITPPSDPMANLPDWITKIKAPMTTDTATVNSPLIYTVKNGDSVESIATLFQVSVSKLKALNLILRTGVDKLLEGWRIRIK